MENMMKLGPTEVKEPIWDDRGKTKIKQILISYANNAVYSIQFLYVVDGKLLPSEVHGKTGGLNFETVSFDYPREYLTSLSGELALYGNNRLVSITFGSNKGNYGPFGRDNANDDNMYYYSWRPFAYNFGPKCSFGGFHGSDYNSCLYAIGIYVKARGLDSETERDDRWIKVKKETDTRSIDVVNIEEDDEVGS